jgi:hypothetical protein
MVLGAINGDQATEIASWRQIAQQFDYHRSSMDAFKFFNKCDGGCRHVESVGRVLNTASSVLMGMNQAEGSYFFKHLEPRRQVIFRDKKLGLPDGFYVNTGTNHAHFSATKEHPLWMVYANDYRQLWVTSDVALLQYVLKRHDKHSTRSQIGYVHQVKPDVLYSVDLAQIVLGKPLKITSVDVIQSKPELLLTEVVKPDLADTEVKATPPALKEEVPKFTREEIREMPTDDLRTHIEAHVAGLRLRHAQLRSQYIKLGAQNWADFVTWNKRKHEEVSGILKRIDFMHDQRRALNSYVFGMEEEIKVRMKVFAKKLGDSQLFTKNKLGYEPPVGQLRQAQVA